VEAVVWATGFHSDYSWICVTEAVDEHGAPIHRRGATPAPGLFLGTHNQHSRGSSLIGFVRHDAAFIVEQICVQRAANPGAHNPHPSAALQAARSTPSEQSTTRCHSIWRPTIQRGFASDRPDG
jgi:hypothetical protein